MNDKFYISEDKFTFLFFNWRDRIEGPTDKDLDFFQKKMPYLKKGYDSIGFSLNLTTSINIWRIQDDYFRIYFQFDKRVECRKKRPIFQKTKPKREIKTFDTENMKYWFICDNREGVIRCLEDHGYFKSTDNRLS